MKFFLTLFTAVCCSWLVFAQQDMTKQEEPELLHGPCSVKRFYSRGQYNDRMYIDMKGTNVAIYFEAAGLIFSGTLNNDSFESERDFGEERNRIVCTFTKSKVTGYIEYWNLFSPKDKTRWEFEATGDDSRTAKQFWEHFFKKYSNMLSPEFDPETWWDSTPERQELKKRYEMFRQQFCVEFDIAGCVVDPQGKPIPEVVLGISCKAWGLQDPNGLYIKRYYITTDAQGKFECKELFGKSFIIFYSGPSHERFRLSVGDKEEILEVTSKPIIVTLKPQKDK